ncbi:MAG: hypothetical protein Q9212_003190 [Teloschistes hypoglaucus]
MSISSTKSGISPATLAFLTIYNPSLSQNDETIEEQILYYYSKVDSQKSLRKGDNSQDAVDRESKNEKMRQIGLAQGMVEFAKTFSAGKGVNSIETEKSRIVLEELEAGWWLLASIDLTRITSLPTNKPTPASLQEQPCPHVEYSAREVSSPILLRKQLIQAHRVFLLHHAQSLGDLFSRLQRPKFCAVLKRYWDGFLRSWDVLLHGNPAVDIFNGLKLAAGGELGIGVGEEEWGSGEREVLEGFINRTDGLVDLIVSRFGTTAENADPQSVTASVEVQFPLGAPDWHLEHDPQPSDGMIFSGIGAIARTSVKDISKWVESLFKHGHNAYGIKDNPIAVSRRQWKKATRASANFKSSRDHPRKGQDGARPVSSKQTSEGPTDFGIPAPIVKSQPTEPTAQQNLTASSTTGVTNKSKEISATPANDESPSGADTFMKYMTLGIYGSRWGATLAGISERPSSLETKEKEPRNDKQHNEPKERASKRRSPQDAASGYFMIGLQGDLEEDIDAEEVRREADGDAGGEETMDPESSINTRIMIRTLMVERTRSKKSETASQASLKSKAASGDSHDRLRAVVYVNRPFIFTFFFELQADNLAIPSFYRSLHHQLGPLQQPLLNSTSPSRVAERLSEASAPKSTISTRSVQPIGDLVYDPSNLSVHTTIPNIPGPDAALSRSIPEAKRSWTRVEALSVHSQILSTYESTLGQAGELERTCKTTRGWWVVWMRLPDVSASQRMNQMVYREAFLIRKGGDEVATGGKSLSGSWGKRTSTSNGWGPGKLANGIGIDARQYIEGLVSLNR